MLSKMEKLTMKIIYSFVKNKEDSSLIAYEDITKKYPAKMAMTDEKMQPILRQLVYDGYFEMVDTAKKDKKYLVIKLKSRGIAFERQLVQEKRELINRFIVGILVTVATTIVAIILRKILG